MHKRDYLVKQFEEFGRVMAILLGLRKNQKFSELSVLINESVMKYTSTEIRDVELMKDQTLIETLTHQKKLSDEKLKMLGDLLFEKGNYYSATSQEDIEENNCYKKSQLIYSFLKQNATLTYSLDMHYKLEILQKMNL